MPSTDITIITLKLQKPEANLVDTAGGDQSCTELDRQRDTAGGGPYAALAASIPWSSVWGPVLPAVLFCESRQRDRQTDRWVTTPM